MELKLPVDVLTVLHQLQTHGYEAYVVGGAIRDLFLQNELPTDWDFTTNATPSQIQELFAESFYENEFGTVGIDRKHIREQFHLSSFSDEDQDFSQYSQVINTAQATKIHESLQEPIQSVPQHLQAKHVFEITTFRSDGSYSDFRRPDQVTWGQTLEEDLHRRDFTINALALAIDFDDWTLPMNEETVLVPDTVYTLIDPHHGLQDLKKKVLTTVGIAHDRFQEDALRMLRAIRIAAQLHFTIEQKTFTAIKRNAKLIEHVSWERIRDEFLKMLASDQTAESIELLQQTHLLEHILPELIKTQGVEQGGHHTTDVWTHSLNALRTCPSTDPIVRLATLLHDIAKPQTFRRTKTTITFYNHEVIGARVAKTIAQRLRLSKRDIQRMFILVRYHMFHYQPTMTDAALRRFMRKVGLENINDILDLRIGDRLGSGAKETSWRLEEMKDRMSAQLHQPFSIKDLHIDGNVLMSELQLKPGPILGEILQHLFELVLEDPELNEKDKLIKAARHFIGQA